MHLASHCIIVQYGKSVLLADISDYAIMNIVQHLYSIDENIILAGNAEALPRSVHGCRGGQGVRAPLPWKITRYRIS